MSLFTKLFDPIFETNKEQQSAFNSRFNNFYENESFLWTTRTFSYLPDAESLKIQALYGKLIPLFECTGLVHIHGRDMRLLKKDILNQKQDLSRQETKIDISNSPYFQWVRLSSEAKKNELLISEFTPSDPEKYRVFVFRIHPDYALLVATVQADPWLKIKLDALSKQITLGFCDHE